jgi:uncharacterized membrane protein
MPAAHAIAEDFELTGGAADVAAEARPRPRPNGRDGGLAMSLGWFSLGLGMAEVAAPGYLARAIGVPDTEDNRDLLRAAGVRELTSGVGILTSRRQAGWMWSRVGGDVMDLALLGLGFASPEAEPARLRVAAAAVGGVAAADVACTRRLARGTEGKSVEYVTRAMTINRPAAEVFAFWRDLSNLPRFMRHLQSVTPSGGRRSHWVATGPAGTTVEWDAELTEERTNEKIAWQSLPGAAIDNSGSVNFRPAPAGQGTEVVVRLRFTPPGGKLGAGLARLFGEHPDQQLQDDLRRFKQVVETGEISRTEASESALGLASPGQPREMAPYAEFARGER